jgi:hypothetical protein
MLIDKGLREFVEAAKQLKVKGVQARFALVGGEDVGNPQSVPRAELDDWVRSGAIEWWGHRADMPEVLRQATVVCLPSYREGMPKALMEAAAIGRAIVKEPKAFLFDEPLSNLDAALRSRTRIELARLHQQVKFQPTLFQMVWDIDVINVRVNQSRPSVLEFSCRIVQGLCTVFIERVRLHACQCHGGQARGHLQTGPVAVTQIGIAGVVP